MSTIVTKIGTDGSRLNLRDGELGFDKNDNKLYIGLNGRPVPILNIDATKIDPKNLDTILRKFDDLAKVVSAIKNVNSNPIMNTIDRKEFKAADKQTKFPLATKDIIDVEVFSNGSLVSMKEYKITDTGIEFNHGRRKDENIVIRGFYGIKLTGLSTLDIHSLFPDGKLDLNG